MSHQPPHLKLVNNTSGTCKVCPTTELNSLTCPCSQQPMHDLTTSPSLLTSNGATRHTASPASHLLPHNQESPHNNASGDPSPLNYMYQQSHTFPASLLLTQHMVPVEPLALTAIGLSTGASLPPKLHMDLAPGHF